MDSTLSQVGFAEFAGKLLSEVFDAVVTSQLDQRRRLDELVDSARLSEEEVASRFLDETQVEAEIGSLFPAGIHAGAPYRPGAEQAEAPPFAALLGLVLKPGEHFAAAATGAALTSAGAARVRNAVRLRLARSHLAALRALVTRGAPQLVVDSGKVAARLTFQLASQEPPAPVDPGPVIAFQPAPATARRRFELPGAGTGSATAAPPRFRLAVRQASDRAPQLSRLQVDVFGEVEVHFRTLLP